MSDLTPNPPESPQAMTPLAKTGRQALGMLGGEVAANVAEVAVLANIDKLRDAAPGLYGGMKGFIKDIIIRPLFKPIESVLKVTKGAEGGDYEARMNLTDEQRMDKYAEAGLHYGAGITAAEAAMYTVTKSASKALGAELSHSKMLKVILMDGGIHVGAVLLMGTPALSGFTSKARESLSGMFRNLGFKDDKADELGKYGIIVQVPNYLAYAADVGYIHVLNKKNGNGLHALAESASKAL